MPKSQSFPKLSADEAAQLIGHQSMVAFSGFTPAGAAKAVPFALAQRARPCITAASHSKFAC